MQKPTYDEQFIASAVIMLEAAGYPDTPGALSRVARHLGIHKQTLSRWARKETRTDTAPIVTQLKRDVTELLDHIIYGVASEVVRRIDGDELDRVTLPQLMTAMGIAVDKRQLLNGDPTERTENRNINVTWARVDYRRDLPNPDGGEGA